MRYFKTVILSATLAVGAVFGAQAMEPLAPVQQQLFTCSHAGGSLARISTLDIPQARCCSSTSHCVEYLSTTTLAHGSKADHT